ncbi:MAG: cytochrome c biogenesis protein ResB [Candidatus Competibacteraceae bacterium]|nr:cytochrome c biogenesis protein ResB [Candidatus Competibacteraceae bacterium]
MFYTSYRRLWAWLALEDNGVRLILAGAAHRHSAEFTGEFNALQADLIRRLPA